MGWFENYLKRAQARKINNMGYTQSKGYLQALALENQQIQTSLDGQNMPGITNELLRQRTSGAFQSQAESLFDSERQQVAAENRQIDESISTAIAKHDAEKEAEKKAKKDALLKGALQYGGAAVGAIVGSIVPGAGTMLGAQIGSGLGGAASSFVGGGGKMGTNFIDPAELQAGIMDTISGISSAVSLKGQRQDMETLRNKLPGLLARTDDEALADLKAIEMAISMGNYPLVMRLIRGQQ